MVEWVCLIIHEIWISGQDIDLSFLCFTYIIKSFQFSLVNLWHKTDMIWMDSKRGCLNCKNLSFELFSSADVIFLIKKICCGTSMTLSEKNWCYLSFLVQFRFRFNNFMNNMGHIMQSFRICRTYDFQGCFKPLL